jgi:hypothetical protein
MLELHFPPPHRIDDQHINAVRQIIAEVLEVQRLRGNRAGNQAIIDKIGLDARFVRDESYWGEAIDYHLGLLYAYTGDPVTAARHFERSGTHPSDGGSQYFTDHQHLSLQLRQQQELALARGLPSVVLACMPRSASASLTQTLSSALDVPIMRVSCGRFPNFSLVPRWLNSFLRGGAVLHDHFAASLFNLSTLRDAGVRLVFVRVRDPRSAAASTINMRNRHLGAPNDIDYESQVIGLCEHSYIPWTSAWVAASADPSSGIKIYWLTQPSAEIPAIARHVLTVLSADYPAVDEYLRAELTEVRANFIKGNEDAWRADISQHGQDRLWDSMPKDVKDLLGLKR